MKTVANRVANVDNIAQAMLANIEFKSQMKLMDFGSGTELLLEIIEENLSKEKDLERHFNGIISSMTMHHIDDVQRMFGILSSMLKSTGFMAIADFDSEDGSFHEEDTGVFHHGFDRKALSELAQNVGFTNIRFIM